MPLRPPQITRPVTLAFHPLHTLWLQYTRTQDLQIGIWSDSYVHIRSSRLEELLLPDSSSAQVTMAAARNPDLECTSDILVQESKNRLRLTEQGSVCVVSIPKAASTRASG